MKKFPRISISSLDLSECPNDISTSTPAASSQVSINATSTNASLENSTPRTSVFVMDLTVDTIPIPANPSLSRKIPSTSGISHSSSSMEWECDICSLLNANDLVMCINGCASFNPRDRLASQSKVSSVKSRPSNPPPSSRVISSGLKSSGSYWTCTVCRKLNYDDFIMCVRGCQCMNPNPSAQTQSPAPNQSAAKTVTKKLFKSSSVSKHQASAAAKSSALKSAAATPGQPSSSRPPKPAPAKSSSKHTMPPYVPAISCSSIDKVHSTSGTPLASAPSTAAVALLAGVTPVAPSNPALVAAATSLSSKHMPAKDSPKEAPKHTSFSIAPAHPSHAISVSSSSLPSNEDAAKPEAKPGKKSTNKRGRGAELKEMTPKAPRQAKKAKKAEAEEARSVRMLVSVKGETHPRLISPVVPCAIMPESVRAAASSKGVRGVGADSPLTSEASADKENSENDSFGSGSAASAESLLEKPVSRGLRDASESTATKGGRVTKKLASKAHLIAQEPSSERELLSAEMLSFLKAYTLPDDDLPTDDGCPIVLARVARSTSVMSDCCRKYRIQSSLGDSIATTLLCVLSNPSNSKEQMSDANLRLHYAPLLTMLESIVESSWIPSLASVVDVSRKYADGLLCDDITSCYVSLEIVQLFLPALRACPPARAKELFRNGSQSTVSRIRQLADVMLRVGDHSCAGSKSLKKGQPSTDAFFCRDFLRCVSDVISSLYVLDAEVECVSGGKSFGSNVVKFYGATNWADIDCTFDAAVKKKSTCDFVKNASLEELRAWDAANLSKEAFLLDFRSTESNSFQFDRSKALDRIRALGGLSVGVFGLLVCTHLTKAKKKPALEDPSGHVFMQAMQIRAEYFDGIAVDIGSAKPGPGRKSSSSVTALENLFAYLKSSD